MGKQMGKYFRKAVVYMCLASIALYIAGCSQVLPGAVKEYIEANQSPLHLQVDGLGIPENLFSDRDLYQVYLSGESHGRKKSYTAKKAFLEYFHDKAGVRFLLAEMGVGNGLLMERYLETGEERLLKDYMDRIEGIAAWVQEEAEFWRWLWSYNQGQEEEQKIHVLGLDIEHVPALGLEGLAEILPQDKQVPKELREAMAAIANLEENSWHLLAEALEKSPAVCVSYFGDEIVWVRQVLENIRTAEAFYEKRDQDLGDTNSWQIREDAMMRNFMFFRSLYPEGKFFGQLGSEHIFQSECFTYSEMPVTRLANLMNGEDSPVAGQVCSLFYIYSNDKEDYFHYDAIDQTRDRFYSLNGEDSPFKEKNYLMTQQSVRNNKGGTCDYFQKVVVLEDIGECEKYAP